MNCDFCFFVRWTESSRSTDPHVIGVTCDGQTDQCARRMVCRRRRNSQVHIIVPLAATGSFLAFRLATRAAVRLSSKADMAFEQHCLQTLLSRGAVRNTEGARSRTHAHAHTHTHTPLHARLQFTHSFYLFLFLSGRSVNCPSYGAGVD